MNEAMKDLIAIGTHVIIKKQNYSKVYKVTKNGNLMLGKHQKVHMNEIIGKPYWSTFEMIPNSERKTFDLRLAEKSEEIEETGSWFDLQDRLPSGPDNRFIIDDGTSQKLSKEQIIELQESGTSGKEIVGQLIENSKSFVEKTKYSQEKYIKKKQKKYFRYITVFKTSILGLHEIYFRQDHSKINNIRMDSLAQLLSYSDVQSDGLFVLYDSGSQGLPAAAMLNRIGANNTGTLINLHPGNQPQIAIVQAMNFPKEQAERLISVNVYSFLRLYYQGESSVLSECKLLNDYYINKNIISDESITVLNNTDIEKDDNNLETKSEINLLKRKNDELVNSSPIKKPKWLLETQMAINIIKESKARGLVIVAKEHPLNIINGLLPFLGFSRPFVIYHMYREPLQETYVALKQRQGVINLRLYSNFLRAYQVLPERTHPDILTNDTNGYILTGYLVE
ncbi:tRNA (adenine(58)-N(1))-methyltransferase non-catalytic subunit TRM6 [Prorops nasuta]|uniref:tRNA (adenine(58)-N(1))-methyltransferase non-catalytic subunit TRM6 n=1 Tax=Prorops nasuta TaxID=863751 RepID=UPI0034CD115E